MERTRKCYGQTDGRTGGGHSYDPLPTMRKGLKYSLCTDMLILLNLHLSEKNILSL
jgi:hypothetical protein